MYSVFQNYIISTLIAKAGQGFLHINITDGILSPNTKHDLNMNILTGVVLGKELDEMDEAANNADEVCRTLENLWYIMP